MSSPAFEAFLARLYADEDLRLRFLASPADIGRESGLSKEDCRALEAIDRDGLILAAESYARKRGSKSGFCPTAHDYGSASNARLARVATTAREVSSFSDDEGLGNAEHEAACIARGSSVQTRINLKETSMMTEPPRDCTRPAILVAVASALATLITIGILGAVTTLFQSRGLPLEELAAAERACSERTYVSEREHCIREWIATRGNRVAGRNPGEDYK